MRRINDDSLQFPKEPGVYILYALTSETGECAPTTINRFCGSDPEGILYIGETGRGRPWTLVGGLRGPNHRQHGAAARYHGYPIISERFPLTKLAIEFFPVTGEEPWEDEDRRIKAFVQKYGEVPPLNVQGA